MTMVLKFVTKESTKVYGPPYTKQEEAEFYSRNANGPVTVARRAELLLACFPSATRGYFPGSGCVTKPR